MTGNKRSENKVAQVKSRDFGRVRGIDFPPSHAVSWISGNPVSPSAVCQCNGTLVPSFALQRHELETVEPQRLMLRAKPPSNFVDKKEKQKCRCYETDSDVGYSKMALLNPCVY